MTLSFGVCLLIVGILLLGPGISLLALWRRRVRCPDCSSMLVFSYSVDEGLDEYTCPQCGSTWSKLRGEKPTRCN